MTDSTTDARLEALETRIAYQDETIDTLNAAITDQWAKIDALTRGLAELRDRLREAETRTSPAGPVDEKPPHY
jgi:SlyX protein